MSWFVVKIYFWGMVMIMMMFVMRLRGLIIRFPIGTCSRVIDKLGIRFYLKYVICF